MGQEENLCMAKTFYIETFGCQMNVHDSEKVAGTLRRSGSSSPRQGMASAMPKKAENELAPLCRRPERSASGATEEFFREIIQPVCYWSQKGWGLKLFAAASPSLRPTAVRRDSPARASWHG